MARKYGKKVSKLNLYTDVRINQRVNDVRDIRQKIGWTVLIIVAVTCQELSPGHR